jgi:hypothetical protein
VIDQPHIIDVLQERFDTCEDWLAKAHLATEIVQDVSDKLADRALAFSSVGNDTMAKALWDSSGRLQVVVANLRIALGDKVSEDVLRADEASRNMLQSALAGLQIGKKEE